MMAGKPIICAINAPKTLVEIYNCGFMADPSDICTINSAVTKLRCMTPQQRAEMGENGRKAVLEHFTYEKLAQRFLDIMNK
jgi:glycosyltransferase involved in cell wall biosynthesis